MSTVYLAHDPHFDRDVAIKLLPRELLHHGNFRRRFDREAKIVASLDHPAIVSVHDFGEQDGQPYLVMRFMAGGSLTDRLKQGAMPINEVSRIISRLAPALDEVHGKGILHRDLKPSNILFDQRNDPFISDFGTAKFTFEHTKLTETGGAVGTPAYMSPEQIQGESNLDGRSDIYSLGVILFEMLSGQHPYQTNTPIGLAVKHIFEPIPSVRDMQPELPVASQNVIIKAMAKNPEERFQTARRLADDLAQVAGKLEGSTAQDEGEETAVPQNRRYALLIHTDTFEDPFLDQLTAPQTNTKKLVELLKNPNIGDFDEVTCVINQSGDEIRRIISRFFADKRHDDTLLIYFSGHAALDGNGHIHFATKTTDHELIRATGISGVFLADEMDGSRARKQILIMDCFFSKVLLSDKRPTHYLPGVVGKAIDTSATFSRHGQDRLILSASDSIHYVWQGNGVSGKPEPSRFSQFFIDGLESGAADVNNDGLVTLSELYEYITDRTKAMTNGSDNRYLPRKWADNEKEQVVLAKNPLPSHELASLQSASRQNRAVQSRRILPIGTKQVRQKLLWAGTFVVIGLFMIIGSGDGVINGRSTILAADSSPNTATTMPIPTSTHDVPTPVPTATLPATTPVVEQIIMATETATAVPTPLPTATTKPEQTDTAATILLDSSIFASPDPAAAELAIVEIGDQVNVLGRSESGNWLYVLNNDAVAGYIFGERVLWTGDFEALPKVPTSPNNTTTNTCPNGNCPALSLDLYPLPGSRCENDAAYRTIYMQGQGGNGRYTYYWNGKKLTGSLTEGFGFEINNLAGDPVIGTGKVVAGDGQTAEKKIFVTDFNCDD
ncbi:MAG: protein kinase [Anaerolineae bacterium]|nr:protein kinase [Anaerolineae bacterium]